MAHPAASEHPVGETASAAVAELVNEAHFFAVEPVGGALPVKSLAESGFAVAVLPLSGPCFACALSEPQAELDPGDEEQTEEHLKCFESHMSHCEGS